MNRSEILSTVQDIFREVFDNDKLVITDETNSTDIEDWDSLEQINLVTLIENRFNFEFDMDEVINFKNVGDMIDVILNKVNKF